MRQGVHKRHASSTVCYVYMEPVVGGCAALLVVHIFLHSGEMVSAGAAVLGAPVWKVALAIHVVAWILQFIGHGVFEGIKITIALV